MKKILLILGLMITMVSCTHKKGIILEAPETIYIVNGKEYKTFNIKVSTFDDIWLFVPVDSTQPIPITTAQIINSEDGKIKRNVVLIK